MGLRFIFLFAMFSVLTPHSFAGLYLGAGAGYEAIQLTSTLPNGSGNYIGSNGRAEILLQTKVLPFISGFDLFGGTRYLNANNTEATLSEKIKSWGTYYGADLTLSIFYLGFALVQNRLTLNVGGTQIKNPFQSKELRAGLKFNLSPWILIALGANYDFAGLSVPVNLLNVDIQYKELSGVGMIYFKL